MIQDLLALCIDALEQLYIPEELMFAKSARFDLTTNRLSIDPPSPRDTAIALIALNRVKNRGYPIEFNTDKVLYNLIRKYIDNLGYEDISLILWADSVGEQRYLDEIWTKLENQSNFFKYQYNGLNYRTMEMAWLLTALCHYYPFAKNQDVIQELSTRVKAAIINNFNLETNLFYASNRLHRKNFIRAKYNNTLASLSSQTFTIMALALYCQLFNENDVMHVATQCTDTLCGFQGPLGQWWWIYNVEKGKIAEKYPVFSVNQDGTVPMALFAVQRLLTGNKYENNIYKGLDWVLGNNELNIELVDWEKRLIWRGIQRKEPFGFGITGYLNTVSSVYLNGFNFEKVVRRFADFEIIKEMYSYHPARFLYAFSDFL